MIAKSAELPAWALSGRAHWRYTGSERPPFAVAPAAGQESVWDYPRPPRVVPDARLVVVRLGGVEIARTNSALRVLETASPPTFYLPVADIDRNCLRPGPGGSRCEWKGEARYFNVLAAGALLEAAAWSYPEPLPGMEAIRDHVSFYPSRLECEVAGERVRPQPGRFYGGWITSELVGPFKGEPGSGGW
jgi:uncharacterized protein (DUF427 family)